MTFEWSSAGIVVVGVVVILFILGKVVTHQQRRYERAREREWGHWPRGVPRPTAPPGTSRGDGGDGYPTNRGDGHP